MRKIFLAEKIKLRNGKLFIRRILNIKNHRCAQYTRLQAEKLFKLKYPPQNAWDLIYFCNVIKELHSLNDLNKFKDLIPGDIILCHNPNSKYNGKLDIRKNEIEFTHTILYIGTDSNNKKLFIQQFISDQILFNIDEISEFKLIPRFILRPKEE